MENRALTASLKVLDDLHTGTAWPTQDELKLKLKTLNVSQLKCIIQRLAIIPKPSSKISKDKQIELLLDGSKFNHAFLVTNLTSLKVAFTDQCAPSTKSKTEKPTELKFVNSTQTPTKTEKSPVNSEIVFVQQTPTKIPKPPTAYTPKVAPQKRTIENVDNQEQPKPKHVKLSPQHDSQPRLALHLTDVNYAPTDIVSILALRPADEQSSLDIGDWPFEKRNLFLLIFLQRLLEKLKNSDIETALKDPLLSNTSILKSEDFANIQIGTSGLERPIQIDDFFDSNRKLTFCCFKFFEVALQLQQSLALARTIGEAPGTIYTCSLQCDADSQPVFFISANDASLNAYVPINEEEEEDVRVSNVIVEYHNAETNSYTVAREIQASTLYAKQHSSKSLILALLKQHKKSLAPIDVESSKEPEIIWEDDAGCSLIVRYSDVTLLESKIPTAPHLLNDGEEQLVIYPEQRDIGFQIYNTVQRIIKQRTGLSIEEKFQKFDFKLLTARFATLATQTMNRANLAGLATDGETVLIYDKTKVKAFQTWADKAKDNTDTLFLVIADEAHWGPTPKGAQDEMLNYEPLCNAENAITILVSATPYNAFSRNSRIVEKYEFPNYFLYNGAQIKSLEVHGVESDNLWMIELTNSENVSTKGKCSAAEIQIFLNLAQHSYQDQNVIYWNNHDGTSYKSVEYYINRTFNQNNLEKSIRKDNRFIKFLECVSIVTGKKQKESKKDCRADYCLMIDYCFTMLYARAKELQEPEAFILKGLNELEGKLTSANSIDFENLVIFKKVKLCYLQFMSRPELLNLNGKEFKETVLKAGFLEKKTVEEDLLCIKNIISSGLDSETHKIIDDLLTNVIPNGKMKIIRTTNNSVKSEFEECLKLTRTICGFDSRFEIIADGSNNTRPYISPEFKELLNNPKLFDNKRPITYEDLNGLPCILLLCEKGRMGDTFPHSFNCMDIRTRANNSPPAASSFKQEIGRMCRYANDETTLPYALVGKKLYDALAKCSQEEYHTPLTNIDAYLSNQYKDTNSVFSRTESVSKKNILFYCRRECKPCNSYDVELKPKLPNRIGLFASPQVGKTGAYISFLQELRMDLNTEPTYEYFQQLNDDDDQIHGNTSIIDPKEYYLPYHGNCTVDKFPQYDKIDKTSKYASAVRDIRLTCLITAIKEQKGSNLLEAYRQQLLSSEGTSPAEGFEQRWKKLATIWASQQAPIRITGIDPKNHKKISFEVLDENLLESIINFDSRLSEKDRVTGKQEFSIKYSWEFWAQAREPSTKEVVRSTNKKTSSEQFHCLDYFESTRLTRSNSIILQDRMSDSSKRYRFSYVERYMSGGHLFEQHHTVEVSIPRKLINNWIQVDGNVVVRLLKPQSEQAIQSTIYVISHNRADKAKLEYTDMGNNSGSVQYRQIIVVQPNNYENYVARWGRTHIIIRLPEVSGAGVRVEAGGCGYARNQIQHIAKQLEPNSQTIFMLDDNILYWYKLAMENEGLSFERANMFEVLKAMENIILGTATRAIAQNLNIEGRTIAKTDIPLAPQHAEVKYTGDEIAMIGLRRDAHHFTEGTLPNSRAPSQPFSVSRVYSAYLINMKNTYDNVVENRPAPILFPQRPFMEDIEFEHACVDQGKLVLKHNKFFHRKVNFSKKPPPKTGMIEWDDNTRFTYPISHEPTEDDWKSFSDFISQNQWTYDQYNATPVFNSKKHTHYYRVVQNDEAFTMRTLEKVMATFMQKETLASRCLIRLPCIAIHDYICDHAENGLSKSIAQATLQKFNVTFRVWNSVPGNLLVIEVSKK